jgi:hypothetical protein
MPKKSPKLSTNHIIRSPHEERIRNLIRNAAEKNVLIQLDGNTYGQGNLPLKSVLIELLELESEHVYNDYTRHKIRAKSELVPSDSKGDYIRNIRLRTPIIDTLFDPTTTKRNELSALSKQIIKEIKQEVFRVAETVYQCDTRIKFEFSKHHIESNEYSFCVYSERPQIRFDFWMKFFSRFIFHESNKSIAKSIDSYVKYSDPHSYEPSVVGQFCFNTFLDFFERFLIKYQSLNPSFLFQPIHYHIKDKQFFKYDQKFQIPKSYKELWEAPADYVHHYLEDCLQLARKKMRHNEYSQRDEERYNDVVRLGYLFELEKELTKRSFNKFLTRQIILGRFDIYFSSNAVNTSYTLQDVTYRELKNILAQYDISSSLQETLDSSDLLLLSEPLFRLRKGTIQQCDTDSFMEALKHRNRFKIEKKVLSLLEDMFPT